MAKIIKSTITLDLDVLQYKENMSENSINIELTVDEAKELYNVLKTQFEGHDFTNPPYRRNQLFDLPAGPNADLDGYNYPASSELEDEPF